MSINSRQRMDSDSFIAWAMEQPETEHYELHDGEIVSMAPERSAHGLVKGTVFMRVRSAIERAGLPCWTFIDSMAVQVTSDTVFEPDVVVRCGNKLADDDIKIIDPLIVIEVLSPSTRVRDMNTKLAGYFRPASLRHYLIIDAYARRITHHFCDAGGKITVMILGDQPITLDPPGIVLANFFV